ncbi:alpha/beta fold hydrolase [Sorangium sp. So ce185]|uniref:alpha/beta fold hydrolase n=1 Tax=Sorangium sp. So ce185 TaxID=3133287 RepID=UPI003F5DBFED
MAARAMSLDGVVDRIRFVPTALRRLERAPLAAALDAEIRHVDTWSAGRLAYYVDTRATGRPVVLLHGVDAAASSKEMAPLFDALRGERPVYALDLPGFGLSERADRAYDRELYRAAVRRFLTDVVREPGGADVIALSLSSEFVAAVACEEMSLVHSLVLVSPTGLGREAPGASAVLRTIAHVPPVAGALYRMLASPPSIRWFLKKSFVGAPDPGLVDYAIRTSKEPGAHRAPLAFISGALFTEDAFERLYARLPVPTLIVHDQDPYSRFERLGDLQQRNARVEVARVAPTRGLPHFEQLDATLEVVRRFWTQDPW